MRTVPVHYLRRNDAVHTPRAVGFVDTETHWSVQGGVESHRLRCWAATLAVRHSKERPAGDAADGRGWKLGSFADWVDVATHRRDSLWIYTHNLGFDAAVLRLPVTLAQRGWELTDFAFSPRSPWMRFRRGRTGLTFADSAGLLPAPLEQIGALIGMGKPRLPANDDSAAAWMRRCTADRDILAAAVLELMAWWDEHELGRWGFTGTLCGWAAMRHTLPKRSKTPPAYADPVSWADAETARARSLVIDPDPSKQEADRLALYSGRRGVWRVGEFTRGPYLVLDFADAYPTVAAHLPLPRRRGFPWDARAESITQPIPGKWEPIAEAVVKTDTPRFPWQHPKGVLYPVGEFVTTLAGPELAEAEAIGALVETRAGWLHELGTGLSDWGRWVIAVSNQDDPATPAVAALAAKHWGRAVLGRFATRSWRRDPLGIAHPHTWALEDGWDMSTQGSAALVMADGQTWWTYQDKGGDEAYPAIFAWVESHVRLRLGRVIDALGPGAVIQANTDGLVLDFPLWARGLGGGPLRPPARLSRPAATKWLLEQLEPLTEPLRLRIKRKSQHVTVAGPQTWSDDVERHWAGVPKNATPTPDGRWTARTWPGLPWQLSHASAGSYDRPAMTVSVGGPYPTGWLTSAGRVLAPHCRIRADGQTELVPWAETPYCGAGHRLAREQHPALQPLRSV